MNLPREEDEEIDPSRAEVDDATTTTTTAAETTTRASRKGLVKLMRGDIIRFKARSELNTRIFFIDYIDSNTVRLISDMRGKADVVDPTGSDPDAHRIAMNLDEYGRFDSRAQVEGVELLYRNDDAGYARQCGLVPGTWIKIEYITDKDDTTVVVYGEIKTLDEGTDCIGVSIYNDEPLPSSMQDEPPTTFVYIDFEFKGLSDELRIKDIHRCAMPKSLREMTRGRSGRSSSSSSLKNKAGDDGEHSDDAGDTDHSSEEEEETAGEHENEVGAGADASEYDYDDDNPQNDFHKSFPAMDDGSDAQDKLIDKGDKVVVIFEPGADEESVRVRIDVMVSHYYDLDQQRENLRDKLIELDGSETLGSEKRRLRMIERYTQLRELYSTELDGRKHRTDYYTDGYKPLAEMLASYREDNKPDRPGTEIIGDWLIPIYVQRRIIYTKNAAEYTTFSELSGAVPRAISTTLGSEIDNYKRFYEGSMTFREYKNAISQNTRPFTLLSDIGLGIDTFFNVANSIEAVATSPKEPEQLQIPSIKLIKLTKSQQMPSWPSSIMSITRYLPGDDVPRWSSGYIARPLSYAMLAAMKHSHASILDRVNSCQIVSSDDRCLLNRSMPDEYHKVGGGAGVKSERDIDIDMEMRAHNAFAKPNSMNHCMFTAKGVNGTVFDKSVILNMVPSTDELIDKLTLELRKYCVSLSPRLMTAHLRPFAIEPHHITERMISKFSKYIKEQTKAFRLTHRVLKKKYEAFEHFSYKTQPPALNALYAMMLSDANKSAKAKLKDKVNLTSDATSVFNSTVAANYRFKEWMVNAASAVSAAASAALDEHERRNSRRILSSSEFLGKIMAVDYGRCFITAIIAMNNSRTGKLLGANVDKVLSHFIDDAKKFTDSNEMDKSLRSGDGNHSKAKHTLAKRYESMDELEEDNENPPIYYDPGLDPTDYEFIDQDKFQTKRQSTDDDTFKAFLMDKLAAIPKNAKVSPIKLKVEAESMMARHRRVQEGDRAVISVTRKKPTLQEDAADSEASSVREREDEEEDETVHQYYKFVITKGADDGGISGGFGKWEHDAGIPETVDPDDVTYFVNVKPGAIVMKSNILSADTRPGASSGKVMDSMAKAQLITKIHNEFETAFEFEREKFDEMLAIKAEYCEYRLHASMLMQRKQQVMINDRNFMMGVRSNAAAMAATSGSAEIVMSPHRELLDSYLGVGSFTRKQELILSFARTHTREANPSGDAESPHWLYCKDSGAKLMPVWMKQKANAFINDGAGELSYISILDKICQEYGIIEGDVWVDGKLCQSGMVIMSVAFSNIEGYDESGFKISTHAAMNDEGDMGGVDNDMSLEIEAEISESIIKQFSDPNARKISDVVTPVLKTGLGIPPDRDGLRSRIIAGVLQTLGEVVPPLIPSKQAYKAATAAEAAKKGSGKPPSYEKYCDGLIVIIALAHVVVMLQCAMPEVRPAKHFRNCKTTFRGFPLDGDGSDDCIQYIACVANGVRDSSNPVWRAVSSRDNADFFLKKIKEYIKKIISNNEDGFLKSLIDIKRRNNMKDTIVRLPKELSVKKWTQFFPLLHSLKGVTAPEAITADVMKRFSRELKDGKESQHDTIALIQCKIMQYSLFIQKLIQDWIRSGNKGGGLSLLLFSIDHQPILENSCCDEMSLKEMKASGKKGAEIKTVLDYFVSNAGNKNISEYNSQVRSLGDKLIDLEYIGRAPFLCSVENTRLIMRGMTSAAAYSEDTIFKGFVAFCKLDDEKPLLDVNIEKLRGKRPADYSAGDEWSEKFKKLKSAGMEYNAEKFVELIDAVNVKSKLPSPKTMSSVIARPFGNFIALLKKKPENDELGLAAESQPILSSEFGLDLQSAAVAAASLDDSMIFSPDIRQTILSIINSGDASAVSDKADKECLKMLDIHTSALSARIQKFINPAQSSSLSEMVSKLKGIRAMSSRVDDSVVAAASVDDKKTLRYSDDAGDAATLKFVQFVKNSLRFMLCTVPGLLLSAEAEKVVVPKHWKFGKNHEDDVTKCIRDQYLDLDKFCNKDDIKWCMRGIDAGGKDATPGHDIMQFASSIPFSANGRSPLRTAIIKELFVYLFYSAVNLYVNNPPMQLSGGTKATKSGKKSGGFGSALDPSNLRSQTGYTAGELSGEYSSNRLTAIDEIDHRRALLMVVLNHAFNMKPDAMKPVTVMREVMASIRRRETEEMRHEFYLMSNKNTGDNDHGFMIKSEMLKLRLGEYSVGAKAGYRTYNRDFDEQERDARNKRIVEGKGDPEVDFEVAEADAADKGRSDQLVDGQDAIGRLDGDEFERDQEARNELEISSNC